MATKGVSLGSSGLDIDTLVKSSIATYQSKYDKKYKAKVSAEWTKAAYADIYTATKDFRTGTISDYKLSSSTTARTATSTLSAVSATANGDAVSMTHDVTVSQLAASVTLQTMKDQKASKDMGTGNARSIKLADIAGTGTGTDDDVALSFTINDGTNSKTISYTYKDLRDQTETDADGKVTVTTAAKTLNDLASDIKSAGLNVKATYDSVNDSFSLTNAKSGSANIIQMTSETNTNANTLFDALHLGFYDSSTKTTTALPDSTVTTTAATLYNGKVTGIDAKFSVDGRDYVKDSNTNTINNVTYTLNDLTVTPVTHDASASQLASKLSLQTATGKTVGATATTTLANVLGIGPTAGAAGDTALSFDISDGSSTKTISYTYGQLQTQKLADFANDIKATGLNLDANYDSGTDSFSLANTKSGSANTIEIAPDADATIGTNAKNLFGALHLANSTSPTMELSNNPSITSAATLYNGKLAGTDAKFTIDGKDYIRDTNTNTINNVTYTLNSLTDITATKDISTKTAKLTIGTDTTALIAKVQKFVDSYNAMLDKLNTKIYEKKDSSYGPLTDTEKKDMSDTQVTTWETKAKTGLLSQDTILTNLVSNMRSAVSDKVPSTTGKYTSLSAIGVTTTDYLEHGKLHLDTDKLTKAIADDPNAVNDLFASKGADNQSSGVAYRLSNVFDGAMKSITNKAGTSSVSGDNSTLGTNIATMTSDLKTLQTLLNTKENYYYNKYNAMETAMAKGTSTINTLASYLGKSS